MNILKKKLIYFYHLIKFFLGRGALLKGNYKTWKKAKKNSDGYEDKKIFEKVKKNFLLSRKLKNRYEQDSLIINKPRYSLSSSLGIILSAKVLKKINIIDYGGSLGTIYFQYKKIIDNIQLIKWNIVEQDAFVNFGKKNIKDKKINFYSNLNECLLKQRPNVFFASSSLQYVEYPYKILKKVSNFKNIKFIIIDKSPFHPNVETIKIQHNPRSIYKQSYPVHIFNKSKMIKFMHKNHFQLIDSFECENMLFNVNYYGLIFIRKKK